MSTDHEEGFDDGGFDDGSDGPCEGCGWELRNCECVEFADPGGNSALRVATIDNPRDLPCPTCRQPDRLTRKDRELGYQCDDCADRDERGGEY